MQRPAGVLQDRVQILGHALGVVDVEGAPVTGLGRQQAAKGGRDGPGLLPPLPRR
jgi:hypothetical protein